jgi:hypothetical protein
MNNLSGTAEQLRAVHKAQEHFLAMFALECIWDQTRPYELLAQDLAAFDGSFDADFSYTGRPGEG